MSPRHLVLAVVVVVVAASVGVGAATPGGPMAGGLATPAAGNETAPLGQSISSMMQASAAQTAGTVENGMWEAAYANASNDSERRALVEERFGELDTTMAELRAERDAIRAAFRNGSIDRTTYLARLSTVVGRLAALGEGIESAGDRGKKVGVDDSRLEELRSQARNLTGPEVSRVARNLTGGQGSPGPPGLFDEGPPGQSGERGPGDAGNASNRSSSSDGRGDAAGNAGNDTRGGNGSDATGNESGAGGGPPSDAGDEGQGPPTETPTPTPTATDSEDD